MVRYRVMVEVGPPHGDLYEFAQTTFHRVVAPSGEVVLTFEGEIRAALSRDTGLWEDYAVTGVQELVIARDMASVLVRCHDGREVSVPLPTQSREPKG